MNAEEEQEMDQGFFQLFNSRLEVLNSNGVHSHDLKNDAEIQSLVEISESKFKDSFEYNIMQYHFNGKDLGQEAFILKAYNMKPNDISSLDEILEYATWKNNIVLEKEIATKIKESGKYDQEVYNYANDLLASLPKGSVLFTNGEIETITGRVLQLSDGLHNSITIIRKDWIQEGRYSTDRLKDLGLSYSTLVDDLKPNIQMLIESNPDKEFYLSLTLPRTDIEFMLDRLFLIGLAYKYSTYGHENLKVILKNWKDLYLKKDLSNTANSTFGKKLTSNYLLSGVKLYFYHIEKGERTKAEKLKKILYEMALISGHSEKLKAWL